MQSLRGSGRTAMDRENAHGATKNGHGDLYGGTGNMPLVDDMQGMRVSYQGSSASQPQMQHPGVTAAVGYPGLGVDVGVVPAAAYATEKTFNYVNDCTLTIGNTPSGFTMLMIHITGTPFFGVGAVYSTSAVELTDAEIHYNSKDDFLLDESIDPTSALPLHVDKDRRLHKVSLYKVEETGEYRIDFVKMSKTGIPELDAQDAWKDLDDMADPEARRRQIELVMQFTELLKHSRDEPDMVLVGRIPSGYPELQPCVGTVVFKRAQ